MSAWLVDVLKIAIPVVLGALVWAFQTLAQRAWTEYEQRRGVYLEIIGKADSLFQGGTKTDRAEFLRSIRRAWLIGSDEVIVAANGLINGIKKSPALSANELNLLFQSFVKIMREDLRKRRWLPPNQTKLEASAFQIDTPP